MLKQSDYDQYVTWLGLGDGGYTTFPLWGLPTMNLPSYSPDQATLVFFLASKPSSNPLAQPARIKYRLACVHADHDGKYAILTGTAIISPQIVQWLTM